MEYYGPLFLEHVREMSSISLNKRIKKNNHNSWDLEVLYMFLLLYLLGTCAAVLATSTSLVLGFKLRVFHV